MVRSLTPMIGAAAALLALSACEAPSHAPSAAPADEPAAGRAATGSIGDHMPGAGPASPVGLWAADARWCAAPSGERRPIRITPTRFEGYENSCAIETLAETAAGYDAGLLCEAEGQVTRERVRMVVTGDTLRLTYLDRDGASVDLHRCESPT